MQRPSVGIASRHAACVIVDAEKIDRLPDQRKILGRPRGPRITEDFAQLLGVSAQEDRVEVLPVHIGVRACGRFAICRLIRRGILGFQVHHQTDAVLAYTAIRLHRRAMGAQKVVGRDRRFESVAMSGRDRTVQIAAVGHDPRLVERDPHLDPVVELAKHDRCVFGEPICNVGIEPASQIIERRRKIPVKERAHRFDAVFQQCVDQPAVEIQSCGIHLPSASRQDPAPRDAEAVRIHSQPAHQRHIIDVAPVVIAGDVAGFSVINHSWGVGEALPDAGSCSVGERRALYLIRRCGAAPEKVRRKLDFFGHRRAVGVRAFADPESICLVRPAWGIDRIESRFDFAQSTRNPAIESFNDDPRWELADMKFVTLPACGLAVNEGRARRFLPWPDKHEMSSP